MFTKNPEFPEFPEFFQTFGFDGKTMANNKTNWSKIRENLLILEMSAANIQGVQWVPGMHDSIVNWSTDLKLYKITVGPREYAPASNSDIVAEYIVNCPALKSELISRITGDLFS